VSAINGRFAVSSSLIFGIAAVVWVGAAVAQPAPEVTLIPGTGVVFAKNVDREIRDDMGTDTRSSEEIRSGWFPEEVESPQQREAREQCERLNDAGYGYHCHPPLRTYMRFILPGDFALGSAVLPEVMKQQLRAFAEVLRGKSGGVAVLRLEGHADATGNAQGNFWLSQQRAVSVRDFLVSLGVNPKLLDVQGFGAQELLNPANPNGAENRRVEIARVLAK
jgi:outer membrane protein OmpA-like peptidoglycan-associated protein